MDYQQNELQLNMTHTSEMKEHLKKLKRIKKDLLRDPIGTPLRKRDRIPITHNNQLTKRKKRDK